MVFDFNMLGNLAELVRELEMNADIAVFVNFDVVYQICEGFTSKRFDALILCKSCQLYPFRVQPGQHIQKLGSLLLIAA